MRDITELLPDTNVAAAGAPQFLVLHALTRALAEFLSKSEAWREWSYEVDPLDVVAADGLWDFEKYVAPDDVDIADYLWLRTKRVDSVLWVDNLCELEFRTVSWLRARATDWRTRTGEPVYFTHVGPSGGAIQLSPVPVGTDYGTGVMVARLVMTTNVVSGMGTTSLDEQIPQLPDRLFENYREVIVSGALAILYAMPGKDWSQPSQVAYHRERFEMGIIAAASAAAAEFGHPDQQIEYGGY
jgi:hypothetical protein